MTKTLLFNSFSLLVFLKRISPWSFIIINFNLHFSMNPQDWDFSKIKQNLVSPDKFVQSFFSL